MSRRDEILKDDAERLKETQARQRRRRDVSPRRPWGTWPKPAPLNPDRIPASFHDCPLCRAGWYRHSEAGDCPEPLPEAEALRRLDLIDVSLTLHCGALFMMAPPAPE